MKVTKFSLTEWGEMKPEILHSLCFNELREHKANTFDFALLVTDEDIPQCYATCIEMDNESIYMQHGGALPSAKENLRAVRGYHLIINWIKEKYKRASTRIENKNIAMLKLAFSAGFLVNGIDLFGDEIFLHLKNDFN